MRTGSASASAVVLDRRDQGGEILGTLRAAAGRREGGRRAARAPAPCGPGRILRLVIGGCGRRGQARRAAGGSRAANRPGSGPDARAAIARCATRDAGASSGLAAAAAAARSRRAGRSGAGRRRSELPAARILVGGHQTWSGSQVEPPGQARAQKPQGVVGVGGPPGARHPRSAPNRATTARRRVASRARRPSAAAARRDTTCPGRSAAGCPARSDRAGGGSGSAAQARLAAAVGGGVPLRRHRARRCRRRSARRPWSGARRLRPAGGRPRRRPRRSRAHCSSL